MDVLGRSPTRHGPDDSTLNAFMKQDDLERAQGYHGSSPRHPFQACMCANNHSELCQGPETLFLVSEVKMLGVQNGAPTL